MRSPRFLTSLAVLGASVAVAPSVAPATPPSPRAAVDASSIDAIPAGPAAALVNPDPNTYPIVLSGDFTGDGQGDLFFHSPSSAPDLLYDFKPDGSSSGLDIYSYSVQGSYRPVVGEFGKNRSDDILWYQPGRAPDVIWDFRYCGDCGRPTYERIPIVVNGTYTPVAGHFYPGLGDDVLWYGDGSRPDSIWDFTATCGSCPTTKVTRPITVNGVGYQPVAGNFIGPHGAVDDVFWYNPSGPESMWVFNSPISGQYTSIRPASLQVSGRNYKLAVADLFADLNDDIVFLGPGGIQDTVWDFFDGSVYKSATPEPIGGGFTIAVGVPLGPNGRETGEFYEDFFIYDPAGTAGRYYDIYWNNDEQSIFYDRYDFDPMPLSELPPVEPMSAARTGADERLWPISGPGTPI